MDTGYKSNGSTRVSGRGRSESKTLDATLVPTLGSNQYGCANYLCREVLEVSAHQLSRVGTRTLYIRYYSSSHPANCQ